MATAKTYRDLINEALTSIGSEDISYEEFNLDAAIARDCLAAANRTIRRMKTKSVDHEFAEVVADLPVLSGTALLNLDSLTDTYGKVDIDMIKWIKNTNATSTGLYNIKLLLTERAVEIEAQSPSPAMPRFYYILGSTAKLIPVPDANYTLKIGYQRELQILTADAVDTAVPFSQKWETVFVSGVVAYLKSIWQQSDADMAFGEFKSLLDITPTLNKWAKKKAGYKRYKVRSRSGNLIW